MYFDNQFRELAHTSLFVRLVTVIRYFPRASRISARSYFTNGTRGRRDWNCNIVMRDCTAEIWRSFGLRVILTAFSNKLCLMRIMYHSEEHIRKIVRALRHVRHIYAKLFIDLKLAYQQWCSVHSISICVNLINQVYVRDHVKRSFSCLEIFLCYDEILFCVCAYRALSH